MASKGKDWALADRLNKATGSVAGEERERLLQETSDRFLVCPNQDCLKLAVWLDEVRGDFCCPACGAVPAGLQFD